MRTDLEPWQVRKIMSAFQTITLTKELLHSAATSGNGFKKKQLELLGIPWPPIKGWLQGLEGKEIDLDLWQQVIDLKGPKKRFTGQQSLF